MSRTFAELHGQMREEKEQRRVDLEHLTQTIGAKVEEAHSGLDDERVARLEREAQTLKRVGEDVFRVQVRRIRKLEYLSFAQKFRRCC